MWHSKKVTSDNTMMKPGSLAVTLDPAAALAGKLYDRPDVAYFITHRRIHQSLTGNPMRSHERSFWRQVRQTVDCLRPDEW